MRWHYMVAFLLLFPPPMGCSALLSQPTPQPIHQEIPTIPVFTQQFIPAPILLQTPTVPSTETPAPTETPTDTPSPTATPTETSTPTNTVTPVRPIDVTAQLAHAYCGDRTSVFIVVYTYPSSTTHECWEMEIHEDGSPSWYGDNYLWIAPNPLWSVLNFSYQYTKQGEYDAYASIDALIPFAFANGTSYELMAYCDDWCEVSAWFDGAATPFATEIFTFSEGYGTRVMLSPQEGDGHFRLHLEDAYGDATIYFQPRIIQ